MTYVASEILAAPNEVIRWADKILRKAGIDKSDVLRSNFLDYADAVRDVVGEWPKSRLEKHRDKLEGLKAMRDDFEEIVRKDPACIYVPANPTALAFHKSMARTRYWHGGNRIAKTQTGVLDNYWVLTRQHQYRPKPPPGGSVFIVGTNYNTYGPKTFETKYVYGENANPLSPVFPEGGKWFHHYDDRKHILTIACEDCANAYKADQCPGHHVKSTLTLYSDVAGPNQLAGAAFAQGQLDEQVGFEFWGECLKRINTVPNSGMIVTETPIYGKAWWTYEVLKLAEKMPPEENIVPGTNRPIIEVFHCSQFEGGLVPHSEILADMKQMTEPEIRARVYGEHVAASENAIFDLTTLLQMREECKTPTVGTLYLDMGEPGAPILEDPHSNDRTASAILGKMKKKDSGWVKFRSDESCNLRVYAQPDRTEQYFISADVAKGLTRKDFSSADVFRVYPDGLDLCLEQVAQYHGHIIPSAYGEELMKLGVWYNSAPVVVERSGPGDATINKMRELGYWALYQDLNDPSATRIQFEQLYGVDTNQATKPMMVALLKSVIKDKATGRRTIILRCIDSIEEMENFIQEPSESGKTITFHAAGTMKDDRVMSAAIGVYVLKTNPGMVYDFNLAAKLKLEKSVDNRDVVTQKFWKSVHKRMGKSRQGVRA